MLREERVALPDGRALAYAEWGDPGGRPLFFFHGIPGSRLSHPDEAVAAARGVRLITADRPGYGLSDFQPGRALLDWPDDVLALADHLGLERFAVAGASGGGLYVAACAYKIPERLTGTAIMSGPAPLDAPGMAACLPPGRRVGFSLLRRLPRLLPAAMRLMAARASRQVLGDYEAYLDGQSQGLPRRDREILARPAVRQMFHQSDREAYRQGTEGHVQDLTLFARPWGFSPAEITATVHLWHGAQDRTTPLAMGLYLARTIPSCRATFLPQEGHFLRFDYWPRVLAALGF